MILMALARVRVEIAKVRFGVTKKTNQFHFSGSLTSGPNCRMRTSPDGWRLELNTIKEDFRMGVWEGSQLAHHGFSDGAVQIEFMSRLPWVLDPSLEPE